MVDRHLHASVSSPFLIGLGRDELKSEIPGKHNRASTLLGFYGRYVRWQCSKAPFDLEVF